MSERIWTSPVGVGAVLAAVVVLAVGCGENASPDDAAQQATASSAPVLREPTPTGEDPTPAPASPAAEPTQTRRASAGRCESGDLKLSIGKGDGAAGTVWRPLRFTNVSDSPCVIHGFPGVSYVAGDDGHQVGAAAYRDGSKGKPVTLAKGRTAYAAVGFTQVGNYDPAECEPTKVRGLRIYPPQETRSMYLANPTTGCANEDVPGYQLKVQTIRPGSGPA
ncbi:MAG: DUF4232 domain-containing protein [Haloechinothrix sp.]